MTKHMDSALLSDNLLDAALDGIGDPLFLIDDTARIQYVNRMACELLGYTAGELISMHLSDFDLSFPDKSWPRSWNLLKERGHSLFETRYRKSDGILIPVELKVNLFVSSGVEYYLVIASSIGVDTGTGPEQNWLKKLISDFLLNSTDWLWETDQKGRLIYVSGRVRNILGYEPEEVVGRTLFSFMADDEAERVGAIFESLAASGEKIIDFECRKRRKDGSTVCLLTNGTPIVALNGEVLGYRGVSKDITYRIEAENEIRKEHALLYSLLDAIPDPIYIKGNDEIFQYCNRAFKEFVGKSEEEIIGHLVLDTCEHCQGGCFCETNGGLSEPESMVQNTYHALCPGKQNVLLDTVKVPYFADNGERIGVIGISRDITEHNSQQKALKLSEQRLKHAQSIAQLGSWDWNIEQDELRCSDESYRIFGYAPQSLKVTPKVFIKSVHPDDRELLLSSIQQAVDQGIPHDIDYRILLPDVSIKVVHGQGRVLFDDAGKATGISGTVQDITAQHQTKQLLKKRLRYEEALAACSRTLLSNSETVVETALKYLLESTNVSRVSVFRNFEDTDQGLSCHYQYEVYAEGAASCLDEPSFRVFNYADGEIFKILSTGRHFAFTPDRLTERERVIMQERGIQSALLIPIYVPGKWYGIIGFGENRFERQWSHDDVQLLTTAADMFSSYFSRIKARNELIAGYDILETAVEEHKKKIDILGKNLWNGIAQRRRKEAELMESEERFKQLANNTTEGFWISEISSPELIYVNPAFINIWGLSSVEDALSNFNFLSYLVEEDDRKRFMALIYEGVFDASVLIEYKIRRDDGSIRWLRDKISPIYNKSNTVYRVAGLTEDITEQKEREDKQLLDAQKQRDSLVREVHHRIKNHLQGITGLLSHEAFKKPEIRTYLDNAIGQINAISTIHGLQGNDSTENVNLLILLASISNSLKEVHLREIQLTNNLLDTDGFCLNQDEAVPVSLILNELLQNAIKHSLPDQEGSPVQVKISNIGRIVLIRISNPADYSLSTESLESGKGNGLPLVRSMMPAEGAVLSVENNEGIFTVALKLQPPVIVQGGAAAQNVHLLHLESHTEA